jgi:hypothetical protein
MTNRLGESTSAYLRSAAHQPIAWFPWGEDAFTAARAGDRPILLDIGAAWCHWCHVMDGESYEDASLARFLNEHFVCIKVDRDERPDVDARYQRAVQALAGQGGWPLTTFLTPDGQVFYGGTYFPPDGKYGRPGFRTVLERVVGVWRDQRERAEQQALTLRRLLAPHLDESAAGTADEAALAEATRQAVLHYDPRHGGFGTQPKFPHPGAVGFLLTRAADTGNAEWRDMAVHTLQAMARGGIHDHLAGGFHRYSVDEKWIVPHFEKMSYDNSELLKAYLDGCLATGQTEFAGVARGIVRWVREELAHPEGGYGASQDADVGLEDDGDYFTWTRDEAAAAIGDDALFELAARTYDIGTAGEMHHNPSKNVLFLDPSAAPDDNDPRLAEVRRRLLAARKARPAPVVDRTRYTGWNGMMAGALIRAGAVLEDPWALDHGLRTLRRIRGEHDDPAALSHSPGGIGGLLDDQVQVAMAALDAHEATGEAEWLDWAGRLLDRVWQDYLDEVGGGLWDQVRDRAGPGLLPTRLKPIQDTPTPSANGTAALALARLAALTQAPRWGERHHALVGAFAGAAGALGVFGATFLSALDWAVHPPTHLVVVEGQGADAAALADAMHRAALRTFAPRRVVQLVQSTTDALPPAVAAMRPPHGGSRGYLCMGTRCRAPADSLEAWHDTLRLG